jgi:hypothetical protein
MVLVSGCHVFASHPSGLGQSAVSELLRDQGLVDRFEK